MTIMTMNDKLILRHGPIDLGHQEIFDVIDVIALNLKSGKEKQRSIMAVNELLETAKRQFAMEEALMHRHHYPQAALHKGEHDSFISRVIDLRLQLEADMAIDRIEPMTCLRGWLSAHITRIGKRLVTELRNQNIQDHMRQENG